MAELKISTVMALLCCAACASGPTPPPAAASYHGIPVAEIEKQATDLLGRFYPRIVDTANGGYWTNFEHDWQRPAEQPKMLVTQARGLWTAAKAASVFPENEVFREAADHGYRFLTEEMWDETGGGFYLYYADKDAAAAARTYKLTYGHAFALYALAEYARINKDPEVLAWVEKAFRWMEQNAHDPLHLGYYNLLLPEQVTDSTYIRGLGWGDPAWKDQNTSIHILEALSNVYQVWRDERVRERLEEMLRLVRDTMVDPAGYLYLNFSSDWRPISHRDSSREYILQNLQYDHQSFGHDIETAYLLIDAAQSLYGKADEKTLRVAKALTDHTLANGFDAGYYGLFDRGYRFRGADSIEIVNNQKNWWGQAEAWHALALMADLYPDEPRYPEAFRGMWTYINQEIIDPEHGGWYGNGLDTSPGDRTGRKAHMWKGAYHDGRALMQVLGYAVSSRQ